jgi:hypothetical protein
VGDDPGFDLEPQVRSQNTADIRGMSLDAKCQNLPSRQGFDP